MDLVANTVMRFAHGPEMHAWFRGTGKNPIVIFVALPAFLEQIEHFLAHGQSTSGILGLSAHDEDRAIDEINVRVGHAEDFIWPHSLPEHDDGDALEGLGGKCQILELLFKRQDVDIRDFLWKGLTTGQVHEPILNADQVASLIATPEKSGFDGDSQRFRLGENYKKLKEKPPVLASLIVSPNGAQIQPGKKQAYVVRGLDQYGQDIPAAGVE
jgi:hypothetical protein